MSTWARTDENGQTTTLDVIPDDCGHVVATPEFMAMLLAEAGWTRIDDEGEG